jgi:hypothetical protein
MSDLQEVALNFALLKAAKEQKEREVELINAEIQRLGERLFEMFGDGTASVRLNGAVAFLDGQDRIVTPSVKWSTSVVDQAAFYTLLRAENNGGLIKETIHHTTLEKWVKERKEQNAALPSESVLKVFEIQGATVRRAPKSAAK